MNLVRDGKGDRKAFYKYISSRKKTGKCGSTAEWGGHQEKW